MRGLWEYKDEGSPRMGVVKIWADRTTNAAEICLSANQF